MFIVLKTVINKDLYRLMNDYLVFIAYGFTASASELIHQFKLDNKLGWCVV